MRIISGEARGRTLYAPSGAQTRPTSDKIRGSLFNILGNSIVDAHVLDLFGGTGALALEALSRGAAHAVVCDHTHSAIEAIRRNALSVLKDDMDARALILKSDYRSAISRLSGRQFDMVFLDPPYSMTDAYADAINRLDTSRMLTQDVLIICERRHDAHIPLPTSFFIYDTRLYGETAIDFVRRRNDT